MLYGDAFKNSFNVYTSIYHIHHAWLQMALDFIQKISIIKKAIFLIFMILKSALKIISEEIFSKCLVQWQYCLG